MFKKITNYFFQKEYINDADLKRIVSIEYKNDQEFAYNWIKSNEGKLPFISEAK